MFVFGCKSWFEGPLCAVGLFKMTICFYHILCLCFDSLSYFCFILFKNGVNCEHIPTCQYSQNLKIKNYTYNHQKICQLSPPLKTNFIHSKINNCMFKLIIKLMMNIFFFTEKYQLQRKWIQGIEKAPKGKRKR